MRAILSRIALMVMMVLSICVVTIAQDGSTDSFAASNTKTIAPVTVSKYPSTSSPPAQTPTTAIPKVGAIPQTNRVLVILVSFNDIAIKQSEASWNQKIFSTSSKSVKLYYTQATNAKVNLVPASETSGTVNNGVVRVKLNRNHPRTGTAIDSRNQSLVRDALIAANGYVNFAQYDTNHNGRIDASELHIMTIIAGQERAYNNAALSVWGHMWGMAANVTPKLDGKSFFTYTQFGEMHGTHMATIGVIAHELGHDFGLLDLYNTNGSGSGLGTYSLMAKGAWGMQPGDSYPGQTPVLLDAYSKVKIGAVTPRVVSTTTTSVQTVYAGTTILRVNTNLPKEYFLIENRQFIGFDRSLIGKVYKGGIAVYYINTNYASNQTIGKQLVTLKEANQGILGYSQLNSGSTSKSDAFYYVGTGMRGKAQQIYLNNRTNPSNRLSNGTYPNFSMKVNSKPGVAMSVTIGPAYPVTGIALNRSGVYIKKNKTFQMGATIMPSNASNKGVTWSTSNAKVATVDAKGKITGKAVGTATIKARTVDGGKVDTVLIKTTN
ncbi:M6 family metalloprotease domain-containing protein [Listeria grandensis FSL F6-0971]|uniref:M6 family metalloprotease domain-containing protein n=1 Tax=Listeria grandensis FSL F6-0971 TaxID=1265819 RepID=W7BF68_9LIST|nr:M6 family metalloprotease domain-containing protein [Listeria grandensis]EUJ23470.1 M6 family metalloprotease domain-containing protein [Listeria grandensis FSL F6-0971]